MRHDTDPLEQQPDNEETLPSDVLIRVLNASPAYRHIGMKVVLAEEGASRIEMEVREELKNLYGTVHGGLLATLMDSACGVALGSLLQAGETLVTLDLRINYLSPVKSGTVIAEGKVVHKGRQTGVAEATLKDESGRLTAKGMSTHFVRKS